MNDWDYVMIESSVINQLVAIFALCTPSPEIQVAGPIRRPSHLPPSVHPILCTIMALGRLTHYAFDAVLLSTVIAGVRRTSGFRYSLLPILLASRCSSNVELI